MKKIIIFSVLILLLNVNSFSKVKRYSFYAPKVNDNIITKNKVFTENQLLDLDDYLNDNDSDQNIQNLLFFLKYLRLKFMIIISM